VKILAALAILLLSLTGYSLGAVLRFGRRPSRKSSAWDFPAVLALWAGVAAGHYGLRAGKWPLLGFGIGAGLVLGFLMSLVLGYSRGEAQAAALARTVGPADAPRGRFRAWRELSGKLGAFQGQILLGWLFLLLFLPVSLAVKLFSDPLGTRNAGAGSHWSPKVPVASDIELFKRQS